MEKFVKLQMQGALTEHQYEKNGQQQVVAKMGFIFTDGINTFYAEAVGDYARAIPKMEVGAMYNIQGQIVLRQYKDKDGMERCANEVRVTKIG